MALRLTMMKRMILVIPFLKIPSPVPFGIMLFSVGVMRIIEATAMKESWNETSKRDAGLMIRMANAANASMFKRSRPLPARSAIRKQSIMMVALIVDMRRPAIKA